MDEVEGKSFQFGAHDDTMKSNLIEIMIIGHGDFCDFLGFIARLCVL